MTQEAIDLPGKRFLLKLMMTFLSVDTLPSVLA